MNWEAIGAVGELVGAAAVVFTLIALVVQMKHSTKAMDESNRLERVAALDRHSSTVSRWRGRLMEHEDLAAIWVTARADGELNEIERLRLNNLWIDFVNTQLANYLRSITVGESGLARQAALSVAAEKNGSDLFRKEWNASRPWHALASLDFVELVEKESENLIQGGDKTYRVGSE